MRYLLFHKPYDVLCQFSPSPGTPTLGDYIPLGGVYPVGRLDRDSEGLVLLTDDGPLQHRLTDPKFGHQRTYWVQVEGEPGYQALEQLRRGVVVRDYRTRPAQVQVLEPSPPVGPRHPPVRHRLHIPTTWLALGLTEGRNRQVRRMTAAVGHPTLRLIRVALGPFTLKPLELGEWQELSPPQVRQLWRWAQLGGDGAFQKPQNHRQGQASQKG